MTNKILALASLSLALSSLASANGPMYSGSMACTPAPHTNNDSVILVQNLGTPNVQFSYWEANQLPKGTFVTNPMQLVNLLRNRGNEFDKPVVSKGEYNPNYRSKNPNFPADQYTTDFSWDGSVTFIFSKNVNAPKQYAPSLATRTTGEGFDQETYFCAYL